MITIYREDGPLDIAYQQGFDDGVDEAVGVCFGTTVPWRDYEDADEAGHYALGRSDGYDSVDD